MITYDSLKTIFMYYYVVASRVQWSKQCTVRVTDLSKSFVCFQDLQQREKSREKKRVYNWRQNFGFKDHEGGEYSINMSLIAININRNWRQAWTRISELYLCPHVVRACMRSTFRDLSNEDLDPLKVLSKSYTTI